MPKKIEDIRALKEEANAPIDPVALKEELREALSPEKRRETVQKIDELLSQSDIPFMQGLVGFGDLFSSIFITSLSQELGNEDAIAASNERINNVRVEISTILNKKQGGYIAEDIVSLLSLIIEGALSVLSVDEQA